jgi:hypothetical protein
MRVEPATEIFSSRKSSMNRVARHLTSPESSRKSGSGLRFSSIACFFLVMAAPGGLLAARLPIVEAAPFMAALYSAVGLPVNLRGLEISGLTTRLEEQAGGRVLLVEGQVANVTAAGVPVPDLTLTVRSADGAILYSWTAASPRSQLDASDRMTFRTRLVSPPEGARDVHVAFR